MSLIQLLAEAFCDLLDAYSVGVCRHLGFTLSGGPTGSYLEGVPFHKIKKEKLKVFIRQN